MITRLALKQGFNKKIMQPMIHQKLRRRYADHPVSFTSSNCAGGDLAIIVEYKKDERNM